MDQKLGKYLRYFCLLLSITLALMFIAYLITNQGEHINSPGIVISYPKSIQKNDCGNIVLTIDENPAYLNELINAIPANSEAYSPEPNINIILETALVFPGMSIDPAGAIKLPWADGSEQSISWKVCSNTEGSFDGTIWIYLYALAGKEIKVDKLPVSAYPIQVNVRSILGLSKGSIVVLLIFLIAVICVFGFYWKKKFANLKHS